MDRFKIVGVLCLSTLGLGIFFFAPYLKAINRLLRKIRQKFVLKIFFILFLGLVFITQSTYYKIYKVLKINPFLSHAHFYQYDFTSDSCCPRTIYIHFKSNKSRIDEIIKQLSLKQNSHDDYHEWDLYNGFKAYNEIEKNLKWWQPKNVKGNRYKGDIFYGHQNNDIRLQVDNEKDVFIIVECI